MSELYKQGLPLNRSAGMVLFWAPGGMPLLLHIEGAIAVALHLRGIEVHTIICDGPFRACVKREITDGIPVERWRVACAQCKAETRAVLDMMGIKYSFISDFVQKADRDTLWDTTKFVTWESLDNLCYGDINFGKNVRSAIIRYLRGNSLLGHEEIVREYAFSGLVVTAAAISAFDHFSPSRIFMSQGIYVDWGPALKFALLNNIPVTAYMSSYLPSCFYFRHVEDPNRIDFHNMSDTAWDECKSIVLSALHNTRLDNFLDSRYRKQVSFDLKYHKKFKGAIDSFRKQYKLASDKPVWGVMLHLNWDAVSDFSPMAYETFDDWILDTIREIIQIPDVQWLIKIHPAEGWESPENGIQQLLHKHFPSLPSHVKVISFDEDINPLDFYHSVDGGVTVYGTAGLELALQGKPVILAGEAHYGGKGFTYDGLDPYSYKQLLRKAGTLKPLSAEQRQLARRYAYCYFIQRQVPFPVVKDPHSTWWKFQYNKRHLLLPGKNPFVDFICDRIMDGKDFIMDEKLVALLEEDKLTNDK